MPTPRTLLVVAIMLGVSHFGHAAPTGLAQPAEGGLGAQDPAQPPPVAAHAGDDVLALLERVIALGDKGDSALIKRVSEAISREPDKVADALVPRLKDDSLTEPQLATYAWALGLAKKPAAAASLAELLRRSPSALVKGNCSRALANLGGPVAEAALLAGLDAATDPEERFEFLNLLGQMQCAAALPKTEEVLKLAVDEFYWKSIFVFGKMGDRAVPFLLQRIGDPDRNVRAHALNLLGQWLIPAEAAGPLRERYWSEPDPELRQVILGSLERTSADLAAIKSFFAQVVAKEQEPPLRQFAQETLDGLDKMRAELDRYAKAKRLAGASQVAYDQLFGSCGKDGDYQALATGSTTRDEPKLKALRERILQRNSDECFYDYQKVNRIIYLNRLSATIAKPAAPGKPEAAAPPVR